MKIRLIVVVIGSAVAVVAFSIARSQRHQREALAALEEKMAALESARTEQREGEASRLAPLVAMLGAQARPAAAPAQPAPSSEVDGDESSSKTRHARPFPPENEVHRQYEDSYARDPPDREWAEQAKRLAQEKLPSSLPPGSSIRSFDCHRSICRLETAHAGREAYLNFARAAFVDPAGHLWNAPTYSTPLNDNADGTLMVTYIAREGQSLPEIAY